MRFFPLLVLMFLACPAFAAQVLPPRAAPSAAAQTARRDAEPGKPAGNAMKHLLELKVLQILAVMALLTAVSEAAERKAPSCSHSVRLAWNWALLAAFLTCCVFGFALLFPLEKTVKDWSFHLHVWTGTAAAWAGLYHLARRTRTMLPR